MLIRKERGTGLNWSIWGRGITEPICVFLFAHSNGLIMHSRAFFIDA